VPCIAEVIMMNRTLAALLALPLLACGRPAGPPQPAAAPAPSAVTAPANRGLFVAAAPADAQLVFVGRDSTVLRGATTGVFVSLSTFSVTRDGIPNEFPPAGEMAALLHAAGVRDGGIVIVGDPIPAGRAFAAFDYLGLADRVALLDGGPAAFTAAPATSARSNAPLRTSVRADMIVDAAWVHARLNDRRYAILDARPPAEFSGEVPGDGIARPGHIPGARNVFWQTLVQSADNPRLRPEAELRGLFAAAGVEAGMTIVAYCRTGGQASFLYTVARHLGYDVRLYDGSYVDWSRTNYPVER
jgi:thiosulfate/3-mercaptopyruvate sulfurtransferase